MAPLAGLAPPSPPASELEKRKEEESCASDTPAGSDSSSSSSSNSSSDADGDDDALAAVLKLLLERKKGKKAKARRKKEKERRKKKEEKGKGKVKGKGKGKGKEKEKEKEGEGEKEGGKKTSEEKTEGDKATVLEYRRVDKVYVKELLDWDIRDTVPRSKVDKYSSYVFTVRRVFDNEDRYESTYVDIKSPLLKRALQDIIGDIRAVSLVEDEPEVDPNMLFLYYDDMAAWVAAGCDPKVCEEEGKKRKRAPQIDPKTGKPVEPLTEEEVKLQVEHIKLLIEYLDVDYKDTRGMLVPLLENKSITFDLLWSVMKPGTLMYTTCAGSGEPRAFVLEYSNESDNFMQGKHYALDGKYLEFDSLEYGEAGGKTGALGWGQISMILRCFKGAVKLSSLKAYPLIFRPDYEEMKIKLIERGRKFISLQGMKFKSFSGLAFARRKTQYVKIHVDGRIMIDPVTFRRVNPNYVVSAVKTRDAEPGQDDDNEESVEHDSRGDDDEVPQESDRLVMDKNGVWYAISRQEEKQKAMEVNPLDSPDSPEPEPSLPNEDDLLTTSPVVLGWAFTEKLWLEFPVSAVGDIVWNSTAFDSLVLPEEQKSIIRALVQFHTSTFDDVIVGKGKGLITVLHGPPGVGKTLTAESISEHLHRPLYTVSSGELGTNPTQLERTLQQILSIATTWNAVLLLDEADIFLEKRTMTDLHRNALVSIFLRLLEYFRGILFLTTNRVETFDDAFQSRIHVALKYPELDYRARFKIWNMFIGMTEHDIDEEEVRTLAKRGLNGRQIKNVVRTAQALASSKGKRLGVKEVGICLDTAEGFEDELKGRGRVDNMHAYA